MQSVDRAVRVLEILARDGEAGVTEIARELGVHTSTASRLIRALADHDLVDRPGGNGRARLGIGLLRLAGATAAQLDLSTQAQQVCDDLAAELGETVNVAILSGGVALNICQAQGSSTVSTQNWVGQRTVLHATSSGKVLLAYLDAGERNTLLRRSLERFTRHTLTSARAIRTALKAVRESGWAQSIEEYEEGLNAIAAPIRTHDGTVIAAISIAGPAYRLGAEQLPDLATAVIAAAEQVSHRMGYSPAAPRANS
ncbi:DNA-binding transcriptional regulator, IclR family [Microlunatus soli]|uniref:DNA-binding transcriptional regulator, IclR family n=1 Tax=Microlunatus soli TaxID=630515 RepID=A0A1H1TLT3_9ACTN|nr:DNA-binding transcriptional regulator, IclR family [Microlunatus soli]